MYSAAEWSKQFPVIGKGILLFNFHQQSPFSLIVRPEEKSARDSWIRLSVEEKNASFYYKEKDKEEKHLKTTIEHSEYFENGIGLEPQNMCTYWLSYDSDRMVVKYGKGYCMEKTTILVYEFKEDEISENKAFFEPSINRKVEMYDSHQISGDEPDAPYESLALVEPEVEFDPDPLVNDVKPLVKDSSTANLFHLDEGDFIYSSSLPPACQALYTNVTAANVDLDFVPPNVDQYPFLLTEAIRYSIDNDGCVLNKKLKAKQGEYYTDENTYLRITLGKENGTCPGVPYVLELWPKDHGSLVHNHGNAYGVMRVLHGGLTIYHYNKMTEDDTKNCKCNDDPSYGLKELEKVDVKKGDVTWLSPRWYQTHRLQNDTNDFCATIQCYAYGKNDHTHWPYFDYMKSCRRIGEFTPDSDFGFNEMYNEVMKEYESIKNKRVL